MSGPQKQLIVINGPNMNLLGTREPEIYGLTTLTEIEDVCIRTGTDKGLDVKCCQSNHEGQIIAWIQQAIGVANAIVINAGALTHTSLAIADALRAFPGYTVEFHMTNIYRREPTRHISYLSAAVDAVICGLGAAGYEHVIGIVARVLASEPTR